MGRIANREGVYMDKDLEDLITDYVNAAARHIRAEAHLRDALGEQHESAAEAIERAIDEAEASV
jgi:hypothetical protein